MRRHQQWPDPPTSMSQPTRTQRPLYSAWNGELAGDRHRRPLRHQSFHCAVLQHPSPDAPTRWLRQARALVATRDHRRLGPARQRPRPQHPILTSAPARDFPPTGRYSAEYPRPHCASPRPTAAAAEFDVGSGPRNLYRAESARNQADGRRNAGQPQISQVPAPSGTRSFPRSRSGVTGGDPNRFPRDQLAGATIGLKLGGAALPGGGWTQRRRVPVGSRVPAAGRLRR